MLEEVGVEQEQLVQYQVQEVLLELEEQEGVEQDQ
jgi:hypothetical protein